MRSAEVEEEIAVQDTEECLERPHGNVPPGCLIIFPSFPAGDPSPPTNFKSRAVGLREDGKFPQA